MVMSIYSKRGTKVKFENPAAGCEPDHDLAKKHLALGGTYTVARIRVKNFSSRVMLSEFPDLWFNTVLFDALYRVF